MPTFVPHRNIDPVIADIRKPGAAARAASFHAIVHLERSPAPARLSRVSARRVILAVVTALVVGMGVGTWWSLAEVQRIASSFQGEGGVVAKNFIAALEALTKFQPQAAQAYLVANERTMRTFQESLGSIEHTLLSVAGNFVPAIRSGAVLVDGASELNNQFLDLAHLLDDLEGNGMRYFQSDGERLLTLLRRIRARVTDIEATTRALKNSTASLRGVSGFVASLDDELGEHYLRRSSELHQVEQFLDSLIELLGADDDRHLAVLFQNPAELRPGGGFIGSYADLAVRRGQMVGLDVRDVYDADGQLDMFVAPPAELRTLTERWGARDANWFFDFPTSAQTVLGFLEHSKLYAERGTTFTGAIAVNIRVIESILRATGPIELPGYSFTVTPDTFLIEVQREVEAGGDNRAGHPKRILSVLAPLLLERLHRLPAEPQVALAAALGGHLDRKDIMLYAPDPTLAAFFRARGVDGSVYLSPNNFWGSYLAVVDTNIAGGKSDAFVDQGIDARIDVDTDGGFLTDVAITRTHRGDTEQDPWWRATNKDYLQVWSAPGSTLVSMTGNDAAGMTTLPDPPEGAIVNTDLAAIERTMTYLPALQAWSFEAFGKQVFGTRLSVAAGKRKTLEARYQTPNANGDPLVPGRVFTFVFDRQSGVRTSLRVTILAPIGYTWGEARGSAYVIDESDPPARLTQTLTLAR